MRYEVLSLLGSNVIRFPVELRAKPSIDLIYEIEPDVRDVMLIAEAFGFEQPDLDARDDADRAMAERIAGMVLPEDPPERRKILNELLKPFIEGAVAACAQARRAAARSDETGQKLAAARMEGGYWLAPLEEAADGAAVEMARTRIEAYEAAGRAHGAARAIGLAGRGEPWRPFNAHEEAEALFGIGR